MYLRLLPWAGMRWSKEWQVKKMSVEELEEEVRKRIHKKSRKVFKVMNTIYIL